MSLTNSPYWFGGGVDSFYPTQINDSLRFEDGSSAYLNRTFSSAPTSTTTSTFSAWAKRGNLGQYMIWTSYVSGPNIAGYIYFNTSNKLQVYVDKTSGGSDELNVTTNAVFRDPSAWYHIVVKYDLAQASNSNKIKIYVNGELQSATYSQTGSAVTAHRLVSNGTLSNIGQSFNNTNFYDGYLSDIYFIDGTALDPTSFGEEKDGTWIPKSYSGSYGTNGFHLEFNGNSNDTSGNSNNWTANNISAHDYVPDSPTNNFATLTPLVVSSSITLAEGNLKATTTSTSASHQAYSAMNIPTSGKWYFECYAVLPRADDLEFGISDIPTPDDRNANHLTTMPYYLSPDACAILNTTANNLYIRQQSTTIMASGIPASTGDIYQIAFDCDTGKVFLGRNNTYYRIGAADGNPSSGTNPSKTITPNKEYCIGLSCFGASGAGGGIMNFGQDSTFAGNTTAGGNSDANGVGDFKYAPPSGFLSLCSANLPEPTIIDGSENFNTVLYTGDASTPRSITGVGFQPDWLWIKERSSTSNHVAMDSVRGSSIVLVPNQTYADQTDTNLHKSFDADGFTIGNSGAVNQSSQTYAAWNWKAGTSFSNSAGINGATIASSGSVNTDAGFSIVSYTGNGVNATVGHGLGVEPSMIFVKVRSTTNNWATYVKELGNTKALLLDTTNAALTSSLFWNNTTPTSSVFSISTGNSVNNSGQTYIAYCFANVEGYSKVGSYIGNYSVNGPFVYTGFKPAFIIIKSAVASGYSWYMMDSKRTAYNGSQAWLSPDQTNTEDTSTGENIDILSNGFKIRTNWTRLNDSGSPTYIYIAFAENPFKYANAR